MTKIFVAVGHGRKPDGTFDSGASGGGQTEQSAGDIVGKSAADALRSWGFDVKDEAYKDDPNFQGTDDLVREWGADVLVSVHHDWIKAAPGFFALWYRDSGRQLGKVIEQHVEQAGFALRDYPLDGYRSDLSILKSVGNIPNTLVECGRIGQYTPAELQAMGRAIATGIAAFLGVATVAPTPEEDDDMTEKDREMLHYAAMWALEAKIDAHIARLLAEGKLDEAATIRSQRPRDIKYWRERWNVV